MTIGFRGMPFRTGRQCCRSSHWESVWFRDQKGSKKLFGVDNGICLHLHQFWINNLRLDCRLKIFYQSLPIKNVKGFAENECLSCLMEHAAVMDTSFNDMEKGHLQLYIYLMAIALHSKARGTSDKRERSKISL